MGKKIYSRAEVFILKLECCDVILSSGEPIENWLEDRESWGSWS